MKLLIHIGPDTLGTDRYASKKSLRQALGRVANKKFKGIQKANQRGHLGCNFLGRIYCISEVDEAVILTPAEYFESVKL